MLGIISTPKSSGRCHGVPRNHGRHDDPVRGAVAPEAIGEEAVREPGRSAPLEQLAKEPRGGLAIRGAGAGCR